MTDTARSGARLADEDSRPYWDGLAARELRMQSCTSCGALRCPPLPSCDRCGATGYDWTTASGAGRIYSWITVRRPLGTLRPDEVPVKFATVEIDGGARLLARYLGPSAPRIGAAVQADFLDAPDGTELVFRDGAS